MDNIYLQGSGAVENAGNDIRHAAERIEQSVRNFDGALERFTQRMEDWVCRLEALAKEKE